MSHNFGEVLKELPARNHLSHSASWYIALVLKQDSLYMVNLNEIITAGILVLWWLVCLFVVGVFWGGRFFLLLLVFSPGVLGFFKSVVVFFFSFVLGNFFLDCLKEKLIWILKKCP